MMSLTKTVIKYLPQMYVDVQDYAIRVQEDHVSIIVPNKWKCCIHMQIAWWGLGASETVYA